MADISKKKRTQALSKFTRAYNELIVHIDDFAPAILTTPQFEKVENCWEKLEEAQDDFIEKTDIDIDADPQGIAYLDEPGQRHSVALRKYSEYLKKDKATELLELEKAAASKRLVDDERLRTEEQERKVAEDQLKAEELQAKYETAKARFMSKVVTFGELNADIQTRLDGASDIDKCKEWNNIESDFKALQIELHELSAIDPSKDNVDVKAKFDTDACNLFTDIQKWILDKLKDSKTTSGGEYLLTPSATSLTTRRETINLPHFKGDESCSPYLEYPSWRKRWGLQIVDYEKKSWSGLLVDHLDTAAKSKFIGWGDDYEYAMTKLQNFYGDCAKVVKCVMSEVSSQSIIFEGDYSSLISYSSTLENNFNRLLNLKKGSEQEMSNSSAMTMIVQKLPRSVREKWEEHLMDKEEGVRLKPFKEFINWLSLRKNIWERMAATEMSAMGDDGCYYGGLTEKLCFVCGKKGHVKRNCPDNQKANINPQTRKPRDPPIVKKFWCALHRADPKRYCFSDSCQELRRLDPKERLKLMKENGDCSHCCGDHKSDDCTNKDRVCGGGKNNRMLQEPQNT